MLPSLPPAYRAAEVWRRRLHDTEHLAAQTLWLRSQTRQSVVCWMQLGSRYSDGRRIGVAPNGCAKIARIRTPRRHGGDEVQRHGFV
jgi:hypothetical protein